MTAATPPSRFPSITRTWLEWIGFTTVFGALAGFLEAQFQFLGTFAFVGFAVGFGQWLAWRRWGMIGWLWLVTTGMCWMVAMFIELTLISAITNPIIDFLTGTGLMWEVFWINSINFMTVMGLLAFPQGALLNAIRGRFLQEPLWPFLLRWVGLNLIAGFLLGGAGSVLCAIGCDFLGDYRIVGTYLGIGSWFLYAIPTGYFIATMLSQVPPSIKGSATSSGSTRPSGS